MIDWKMIDADGHIREVESDVFEYLPDYYKARREAVLYFPLLPHHGWHRQAGRGRHRRSVSDSDAGRLAPGARSRQHRSRRRLSHALHAYRPGRHDGFRRRSEQGLQRLSLRSFFAAGTAAEGHRGLAAARCSRRGRRAAPRGQRLRHGRRGVAGRWTCRGRWGIRSFTRCTKRRIGWAACSRCTRKTRCATTTCSCGAAKPPRWLMSGRKCANSPISCFPGCWADCRT